MKSSVTKNNHQESIQTHVEGKKANRVGEDVTPESTPTPSIPEVSEDIISESTPAPSTPEVIEGKKANRVGEDVIPESTPAPSTPEMNEWIHDEFETPFPTALPEQNNIFIPDFEFEDNIPTPSSTYLPMEVQTNLYQKRMIENQNHKYHTTSSESNSMFGIYSLGLVIIAGFSIFAMYRKRLQYQTIPDAKETQQPNDVEFV